MSSNNWRISSFIRRTEIVVVHLLFWVNSTKTKRELLQTYSYIKSFAKHGYRWFVPVNLTAVVKCNFMEIREGLLLLYVFVQAHIPSRSADDMPLKRARTHRCLLVQSPWRSQDSVGRWPAWCRVYFICPVNCFGLPLKTIFILEP